MSRLQVRLPLVLFTALALAAPAAAQTPGLPFRGGSMPTGFSIAATAGWTGASHWVTEGFTLGGTVGYGWSRLGLTASVARFDPDYADLTEVSYGVGGSFRVLGGNLDTPFQVDLLGGFGSVGGDDVLMGGPVVGSGHDWHAQAGVGATLSIATPVGALRPWLAPRAEIYRGPDGADRSTATKFAGSAGIDFRLLGGLGLHALWDKIEGEDQVIGVGASYRF